MGEEIKKKKKKEKKKREKKKSTSRVTYLTMMKCGRGIGKTKLRPLVLTPSFLVAFCISNGNPSTFFFLFSSLTRQGPRTYLVLHQLELERSQKPHRPQVKAQVRRNRSLRRVSNGDRHNETPAPVAQAHEGVRFIRVTGQESQQQGPTKWMGRGEGGGRDGGIMSRVYHVQWKMDPGIA